MIIIMCNISACAINNDVDKQSMVLCVEWNVDKVEILILRSGELPLRGQMTVMELVKGADNFSVSKEEYLADMKHELSGANPDIKFLLKENVFFWKKTIWTRGKFICTPLTQTIELSDFLINVILKNCTIEERTSSVETENKKLRKRVEKMEKVMDRMSKMKNSIENELYKRFLILLNSKKNRIRALRDQLYDYTKDSMFDKSTDESDLDTIDIDLQSCNKNAKIDMNAESFEVSSAPSSSAVKEIDHVFEHSQDSDESFELKLEESQTCRKQSLNITDEDPEEDIFSS